MATRTKSAQKRDIACIRIGFEEYLMDADKAMQALKLLREAIKCQRDFNRGRTLYIAGTAPELELTMVDYRHIVMRDSAPALEDQRY